MADLKSLNAKDLPDAFDLKHHGEKPIISVALEAKAIRKLQHPVRSRKLEGFIDNKIA